MWLAEFQPVLLVYIWKQSMVSIVTTSVITVNCISGIKVWLAECLTMLLL